MLFNSFQFIWFFPLVVLVHFALPHRFRWVWLLAASYYFYMCWRAKYAFLLLGSTTLTYVTGILIGKAETERARKGWLVVSLVGNLGLLFFFKYSDFANESLRAVFGHLHLDYAVPVLGILLPVGISFHVFQSISYDIDVYRKRMPPEKHFGMFAVYNSFFPQLVAGPIERAINLLPQFRKHLRFDPVAASWGLKLMLWGMFKKVVIADRLAQFTSPVFDHPVGHSGASLLLATYFFAFQIFCDFSGYTDIAIGAAKVMGFDLMKNFNRPYFADSIADFWRRWHISLSTWFKDYLYFPLGGNRVGQARWCLNVLVVFLVSGLWHGANWTYVIWGGLHGFYLVAGELGQGFRARMAATLGLHKHPLVLRAMGILLAFHLVLFAWIFFRVRSLHDALYILKTIAMGLGSRGWDKLAQPVPVVASSILLIGLLELVHSLQARPAMWSALINSPVAWRWAAYLALLLGILNLRPTQVSPFIYFQF